LVIACLRKLQCWSVSSTMAEFGRFCLVKPAHTSFIETFHLEIEVVPRRTWLIVDYKCMPEMVISRSGAYGEGWDHSGTSDFEIEIFGS
jgi:hypothetical protein